VKEWLDDAAPDPAAHALLSMMVRLSCYAHAPELLGADTAVRQLAHTIKHNVMYLDGGWQSLVDSLLEQLKAAGVPVELGLGVKQIEQRDGQVSAIIAQDGRHMPATNVVAAVDPQTLATLLPADDLAERWARASVPLRAACLDIGVRELPHPERLNVQALHAPLYFANHTAYARLAPEGAHLLSLVRYLAPGEDGRGAEPELRAFLERVQPGVWDKALVRRFMPNMVVHNDLPGSARARAEHPAIAGLHLVSDVSSARAMLADAVLDSAEAAAQRILKQSAAPKDCAA
jgi:phytoene dehydrogenase-like protein